MFTAEAIEKLALAQAITAANVAVDESGGRGLVALPDTFTKYDLEDTLDCRRRARGSMETSQIDSFASYVGNYAEDGATVLVNQDSMRAVAFLNLGTVASPGHADNVASFRAKATAAYVALTSIANGAGRKQTEIAEFFEDWAHELEFFNESGPVTAPKAIAAIRKLTIESMRKLESAENQLSASRSAFESVQATSADPIPTGITFTCEPYKGLSYRTFNVRLSVLTANEKPTISLRIVKAEEHQEQMAQELAGLVSIAVTGIPVLIGTYQPGK